jgi:hypothetical protein
MSENAGIEDQQGAVRDATGAPDQTQVAEDPTGEAGAYGGLSADAVDEPDEVH